MIAKFRAATTTAASIALLLGISTTPARADQDIDPATQHLFRSWGNVHPHFEQQGVEVNAILTLESVNILRGGVKTGRKFLANFDFTTTIDTHDADWWDDGIFFFYILANAGGDPTTMVGDVQTTSNIEAYDTIKLFEAWYQHQLGDRYSALVGLYNYNAEFYTLKYAGTFFTSSFGIGPDVSQAGPSIFPTTALAARLNYTSPDGLYILGAVFDGAPGDPADPRGTQITLDYHDGVFYAVEAGYNTNKNAGDPDYTKLGIGIWHNTQNFMNGINGSTLPSNGGVYIIGETTIKKGLGTFLQIGAARKDRNQIANYFGTGMYCAGLLSGRGDDIFAVGLAQARNSHAYRTANPGKERDETILEINYMMQITPWLIIQPAVQYVMNPSMDPTVTNAWVAGARFKVAL